MPLPTESANADAAAYILERDQLARVMRHMGLLLLDIRRALPKEDRRRFARRFQSVMAEVYPFSMAWGLKPNNWFE